MPSAVASARDTSMLRVSELVRRLRARLEVEFDDVLVCGEVSNLRRPSSGHLYFRLKDERSQIAAVMFRSAAGRLRFRPEDGLEVVLRGRVGLYEVRGDLQLYAERMEPLGVGALQLAFEQLKRRLEAEGLFAVERKRPLPRWPRRVGVVTARAGAAVHDIVTTLRSRWPGVRIVLRPVPVQGDGAAPQIVAALRDLDAIPGIDVVILGRGGGSIEDLWAFNEESVARAIVASRIPVVSAVGHETDFTIADFVADARAATPTAAAALVVPDAREWGLRLHALQLTLQRALHVRLQRDRDRLRAQARRLRDPRERLREQRRRVRDLAGRGVRAYGALLRGQRQRADAAAARLHALSPLAVLARGYSIARRWPEGEVVRRATDLQPGDRLRIRFAEGSTGVRVEETDVGT